MVEPNRADDPAKPEQAGVSAPAASVFEPAPEASDNLAIAEAAKLANGEDLKQEADAKEHGRHQRFRDHLNAAALILFWAIAFALLFGIIAYTWHLITPKSLHWLAPEQLDTIKTILAAAIFSSALSGYVGKRISG